MSGSESLARTYNVYETIKNQGEMENAILHIIYGELLLKQSKILVTAKETTKKDLLSLDLNKLKNVVTNEQFKDLLIRRDRILHEIDTKPLDYYPVVRWYYFEMVNNVREYFQNQNFEDCSEEDIVNNVLERFKKECRNTSSENITIKTTLAELLLLSNIRANKCIGGIKRELEQFDLNDIVEQLSEDEERDLSSRIKNVLSKL